MGKKYSVNQEFFNRWSHAMAYILGFIYADGSLEDSPSIRGKYIRFTSTDKILLEQIKNALQSKHSIVTILPKSPSYKEKYLLRIGSLQIFDALLRLGLYPKKSLTIRLPVIPDIFLADFVRGYFDGDGCVFLETKAGLRQREIIKRLSIIFTSGSKMFLEDLIKKLREIILLKQDKVYNSHRSFQLRFATADSLLLFKFLYRGIESKLYLDRKFAIFRKYFLKRKCKLDFYVENILKYA